MRTFEDPETLKKAREHFRALVALVLPEMQLYTGLAAPQEIEARLIDPYADSIMITAWDMMHHEEHHLPADDGVSDGYKQEFLLQSYSATFLMFWFLITFSLAFETAEHRKWRPGPELTLMSMFELKLATDDQFWSGPPSMFFSQEAFRKIIERLQADLPPGTNLPPDARALLDLAFPG